MSATELRIFIYDWIATHGTPPTIVDIAAHFAVSGDDARSAIANLRIGKTVLVHPDSGEIWMAGPFASRRSPYELTDGKQTWWANCGWDMFGVATLLGRPLQARARCEDCGDALTLECDPAHAPESSVLVHFLLPARRWYDDIGFT